MNRIVKIGRYEIPIASVLTIERDSGLFGWREYFANRKYLGWLAPCYRVCLVGGVMLCLNETEKQELDSYRETHSAVMQVYGMFQSWQQSHGIG